MPFTILSCNRNKFIPTKVLSHGSEQFPHKKSLGLNIDRETLTNL